jgi:hypothetical protein
MSRPSRAYFVLKTKLIRVCEQLNHAAPDWAFNVYLWTWILLAFFILVSPGSWRAPKFANIWLGHLGSLWAMLIAVKSHVGCV